VFSVLLVRKGQQVKLFLDRDRYHDLALFCSSMEEEMWCGPRPLDGLLYAICSS
jgi:hypothetical protein